LLVVQLIFKSIYTSRFNNEFLTTPPRGKK